MGLIGKTNGLTRYGGARKKEWMGLIYLYFLLEANGANPVFYLYF